MIFNWIVLDLYAHDLHKNAEKPGVISFLSQIFCQKAVLELSLSRAVYALPTLPPLSPDMIGSCSALPQHC